MALKDAVKVTRKTFLNPSGWLGYDMLKSQFVTTWAVIKDLYSPPVAGREETFEQATQRFNLTDEQLNQVAKNFLVNIIIFVTCAVITLLFSLYLLVHHGSFAGMIIGLGATAIFLAYAFRFSFWRFEIKHRKLGCTFDEWWQNKPKASPDKPDSEVKR